jgi:hypothetical protein
LPYSTLLTSAPLPRYMLILENSCQNWTTFALGRSTFRVSVTDVLFVVD